MSSIKIQIDSADKILLKRNLGKNGKAQKEFTQLCAKKINPYVPYLGGDLKDKVDIGESSIKYNMPYAAKQYYTNQGKGAGSASNGGMRGKYWDKRCWAQQGKEIVKSIAEFCGGQAR
jgi:hypothetical protein